MHVAAQKVFHRLIEEKLQVESPRVGKSDQETGQTSTSAAHGNFAEVGPVDLSLLAGEHTQAQKRFHSSRPQPGHSAPQLHHASGIATIANHVVDARGTQAGMTFQGLANELQVGIGQTRTQSSGTVEPLTLDGMAHGIGMEVQFPSNGADLPMLRVEPMTNLRSRFVADHRSSFPPAAGKRIEESPLPAADQTAQPSHTVVPWSGNVRRCCTQGSALWLGALRSHRSR